MYGAIWKILPGPWWVKVIIALALIVGVVYLLFTYVYPVVAPHMPFQMEEEVGVG